ncbi:MAG: hypothetical protein KatS3mg061_0671 [Dehalococcoidia bacterium]|nr:MAG: hypothetical protein KatS3mg061_0671 [Dehalococcoidia bacterium]
MTGQALSAARQLPRVVPLALSRRWSLLATLVLAALLRFWDLAGNSLWYDEGFSAFLASEPVPELVAHTARDIHPPLYYLLLHGWTRLAGRSDFSLAFFSLAFGLLGVALVAALARRWFGERAALLAALLAATSPFQVWYAQEVRMYTLAAFLALLTLAAAVRGAPADWWRFALAAALGLYVLYYSAFLLLALNLFVAGWFLVSRRLPGKWSMRRWLAAQLLIGVLYLPWLPIAFRQAIAPAVPPWREATPFAVLASESFRVLTLGQVPDPALPALIVAAGLLALALGRATRPQEREPVLLCAWAVAGPIVLIAVASLLTPLYHPRYLFPFSLPFLVLLGAGLARLSEVSRVLATLAAALLLLGFASASAAYHTDDRVAPDDYRSAVSFLAERWQPGDAILINAGYVYAPFVHYWPGTIAWRGRITEDAPASAGPIVYQLGTIDGPASLGGGDPRADFYPLRWPEAEAALQRLAARHPRLWLLRAYDTVTDPQGQVRAWLAANGRLFADVGFRGSSNIRVQGYILGPATPGAVGAAAGPVELSGSLLEAAVPVGGVVQVPLAWRPLVAVSQPLRAYLALVDPAGRLWAQQDQPAVGPAWTPASWRVGVWTPDPRLLLVPAGTPPGRYSVELGVYVAGGPALEFPGPAPRLRLGSLVVERAVNLPDPPYRLPVQRVLAPGLLLAGVNFGQFEAREGETLQLDLFWRALQPAPVATPVVRLWRTDGQLAAEDARIPLEGRYPPSAWQAGELLREPRELVVPPGTQGRAWLEVSAGGNAVLLAELFISGRQRRFDLPPIGQPVGARLGEIAELVAVASDDGDPLRVTLIWRALGTAPTSYTVFVQALDRTGRLAAQYDALPAGGDAPTTSWLPGEVIIDQVTLSRRAGSGPGPYHLIAGLYDGRSGERLRLPDGSDAVSLGMVRFSAASE